MNQTQMEYVGKIPELRGKTAILRGGEDVLKGFVVANRQKYVLAQFLDETTYNGVRMDHGWHHFALNDFTPLGSKPVF